MKKNILLLIALITSLYSYSQIKSDKITPPQEGKSVIYFLRTTSLGALMNIRYFNNGEYLGRFKGRNYIRYECDPGKTYFWIKAENIDVLEATLEPNKIYLVETNAVMGAFSAGAKFKIVDFNSKKQIKRINKLLAKKDAKKFSDEELNKQREKMEKTIQKSMKKVRSKMKKGKFKTLTGTMNYTAE
ncbi:hypothetical protein F7018_13070 [Tenacibaculum aiptasiae]|uniref:DUF2846 domain-containing protein n=1 Tax=Tenacibaculum aiptasiae TaxID=426481 RepID=A0A7J5AD52_9FLAO|nr:hypothetical protein [Tenacibaculum aiptasiae]KAB1155398.1 hypothetical protein F7018_13070 [Tenacibaculum aiptasiae]